MADPAVQAWKQRGNLYIWRYTTRTKNWPGWHLHVDVVGSESLLELIDLMLKSPYGSRRRIVVTPQIPFERMNPRAESIVVSSVELVHSKGDVDDMFWSAERSGDVLVLTLGAQKLSELRAGIEGVPKGRNDYAIGPGQHPRRAADRKLWNEQCLWFW